MVELEWVGLVLMSVGALLVFISGIGMLRLPDLYMRMSATTKSATLGLGLLLVGIAIVQGSWLVTGRVLLTLLFLMLTAPIAAQAIGQAAYLAGVPLWRGTIADELNGQTSGLARVRIAGDGANGHEG
jgi:multicomponent Na+:H+ antiporter subunit G